MHQEAPLPALPASESTSSSSGLSSSSSTSSTTATSTSSKGSSNSSGRTRKATGLLLRRVPAPRLSQMPPPPCPTKDGPSTTTTTSSSSSSTNAALTLMGTIPEASAVAMSRNASQSSSESSNTTTTMHTALSNYSNPSLSVNSATTADQLAADSTLSGGAASHSLIPPIAPYGASSSGPPILTVTGTADPPAPASPSTTAYPSSPKLGGSATSGLFGLRDRSPSPARPMLTGRSSSSTAVSERSGGAGGGGAKLAAFASRLGSTASSTVHRVTQTAAAAISKGTVDRSTSMAHSQSNSSISTDSASSSPRIPPASGYEESGSGFGPPPTAHSGSSHAGSRTVSQNLREKGASLMSGAAARLGRAKGKDRAASHGHTQSLAMPVENGSLPIPAAGTSGSPYQYNLAASPNPSQHSSSSPEMETSARFAGGTGLSRRESAKSRFIFGVRVPTGKAGEVFGAPIRVAADRTKLSEDKWIDLPGAGMHEAERRREACKVLPAVAIRCLDYLNEYGKTEEGLYRIPGSSNQVSSLRTIFDAGADIDLLGTVSTRDLEPSGVASCFKLWLRELPDPLLHSLEREIDILLLEHTGNAASSKVTMAQAQSPQPYPHFSSGQPLNMPSANAALLDAGSPVVDRIRDLFAQRLPKEHIILLREICFHLAHLDQFSSVTKMTFSNLRLILSPTLKLSPVMLSLLVKERDSIFPRPGQLDLSAESGRRPSRMSIFDMSDQEADLSLSMPSEAPVLPMPADLAHHAASTGDRSMPVLPRLRTATADPRTPFSSTDPAAFDSGLSFDSVSHLTTKGTPASLNYRASWHVVDFPRRPSDGELGESGPTDDNAATPIAKKFLEQKHFVAGASTTTTVSTTGFVRPWTASTSSDASSSTDSVPSSLSPPPPSPGQKGPIGSTGPSNSILNRTPTLSGRSSPSPFFSSGASPAGLGLLTQQARKRSSLSSMVSTIADGFGLSAAAAATSQISPSDNGVPRRPSRSHRRLSSQSMMTKLPSAHDVEQSPPKGSSLIPKQQPQTGAGAMHEEEEELCSSDTNTSGCSSTASSAQTPKDSFETDDYPDNRRTTITADNFVGRTARSSVALSDFNAHDQDIDIDDHYEEEEAIDGTPTSLRAGGNSRQAAGNAGSNKRGSMMLFSLSSLHISPEDEQNLRDMA